MLVLCLCMYELWMSGGKGGIPMRSLADKPHKPSSFQGHCHWPSKHIHGPPHSGG